MYKLFKFLADNNLKLSVDSDLVVTLSNCMCSCSFKISEDDNEGIIFTEYLLPAFQSLKP